MDLLQGLVTLLVFQLLGTLTVMLLGIGLPGPVLGMILLFIFLLLWRRLPKALADTASGLLAHLSLLFIPAGVGVVAHLERIGSEWLPIAATLLIGTLVAMALTALTMHWMNRWLGRGGANGR